MKDTTLKQEQLTSDEIQSKVDLLSKMSREERIDSFKILDWVKLADLIIEKDPDIVEAGCSQDMSWTCDIIYSKKFGITKNSGAYVASAWDEPVAIFIYDVKNVTKSDDNTFSYEYKNRTREEYIDDIYIGLDTAKVWFDGNVDNFGDKHWPDIAVKKIDEFRAKKES